MKVIQPTKTQLQTSSGLTFSHPAYKGTHAECMQQIEADGLQTPTYAQVIELVYEAIVNDPKNQYSKEIKQIMREFWLRADTGLLYTPSRVFVQDRPRLGQDRLSIMQESELEAKLQAGDSSVRVVDYGFKIGEQSSSQLAKNKLVIGLSDEEHAEKLAEIADSYKLKPYLYALRDVKQPTVGFPALDDGGWVLGNRLNVYGIVANNWDGHAFGVRIAEGDAQKI